MHKARPPKHSVQLEIASVLDQPTSQDIRNSNHPCGHKTSHSPIGRWNPSPVDTRRYHSPCLTTVDPRSFRYHLQFICTISVQVKQGSKKLMFNVDDGNRYMACKFRSKAVQFTFQSTLINFLRWNEKNEILTLYVCMFDEFKELIELYVSLYIYIFSLTFFKEDWTYRKI